MACAPAAGLALHTVRVSLLAPLLALCWLTPFASGPSPAVMPWLACLILVAALMLLIRCAMPASGLTLAILYFRSHREAARAGH